jgi:membrane protein required for colicin V production
VNWVDLIIAVVLVGFAIRGLIRGFFRELLALVGLFLGLWVALLKFVPLGEWLQRQTPLTDPLPFHVAFLAIFFGVSLLANITGFFLQKVAKGLLMGWLDAVTGLGFGVVKGVMVLSVLLFLVAYLPLPETVRAQLQSSPAIAHLELANPFLEQSVQAYKKFGGDRLWEQFRLPESPPSRGPDRNRAAGNAFTR